MVDLGDELSVQQFLAETSFSGYQRVPLPYGLHVPGTDRQNTADVVFRAGVEGKSVLDVGTYYGFFPCEAMLRGAERAVGVEADPDRCRTAANIAAFHENRYSVVSGRAEELALEERFDLVLCLNVLHHLLDPVAVVRRLAAHCRGSVVIEFCTVSDPAYLRYLFHDQGSTSVTGLLRTGLAYLPLRLLDAWMPLVGVGNRSYHRVFYFSKRAFTNLFVIHHRLFGSVEFVQSPVSRHRVLAFCSVLPGEDGVGA